LAARQKVSERQDVKAVHIVGIGGAGMSAIARVLHGRGVCVQGSDRRASPITEALQAEGIPVFIGHAAENVGVPDLVLASSAVPDDNEELQAARAKGVPVLRRPEFLPWLTAGYDVIAVAGAHGKTTVTGMIAKVLVEAGADPSFIVGGVMKDLGTNGRAGRSRLFVFEADEYRETFLALEPTIAVVTNVEFDHPDCFADMDAVRRAFERFVSGIRKGGVLIACGDDPETAAIAEHRREVGEEVILYGLNESAAYAWRATEVRPSAQGGVSLTVWRQGDLVGQLTLRIPGRHNASNALAALAVGQMLGIESGVAFRALKTFSGTGRRFEVLGERAGVTVIDDYAHHPTQIRGVLRAARGRYGKRRLIAVWEPHTFSRVRALYRAFMGAFDAADRVVILPIYAAREVDDGTLTAEMLGRDLQHGAVWAAPTLDEAVEHLRAMAQPGDVILLMGAGDEYRVGQRLLAQLEEANGTGTAVETCEAGRDHGVAS